MNNLTIETTNTFEIECAEDKSIPRVVFVCAPGLPPLDMWLPVLASLRRTMESAQFIFLAPKPGPIRQMDLSGVLHKISSPIFDSIIFPIKSGYWKEVDNFEDAKKLLDARVVSEARKVLKKTFLAPVLRASLKTVERLKRNNPMKESFETNPLAALSEANGVVLFDLFAADAAYVREAIAPLQHMPKFSMLHGINVLGLNRQSIASVEKYLPEKTKALLFSDREERFYRDSYGLSEEHIKVVGIPRHEVGWIRFLSSLYEGEFVTNEKFIFVISRGSDERYFPRDMKVKALEDVRDIAAKDGLFVVVKRHPKEDDDGPIQEVFGARNYGKTWSFSDVHPIVLGLNCEFAVSFYSGVAIDMVRLGTPIIERFDANILAKDSLLGSVDNGLGELSSPYSHLGLVFSARNRSQFMDVAERVLSDRAGSGHALRQRYKEIFPEIEDVSDRIAYQIAASIGA